jgi:hypothetical protein
MDRAGRSQAAKVERAAAAGEYSFAVVGEWSPFVRQYIVVFLFLNIVVLELAFIHSDAEE